MPESLRFPVGRMLAEAEVSDAAAFLNLCAREGIRLSETESIGDFSLRFRVSAAERERLEQLALRCGGELRVLRSSPGERLLERARSHLLLGGMTLLFALLLLFSSLFLWEIDVESCPEELPLWELRGALDAAGIRKGAFIPALSPEMLCSRALERLPELESLSVNFRGSRAVIRAVGKREIPEIAEEKGSAELVAAHQGVLTELRVLSGTALVNPGMAVDEGDRLVVPSATANRARAEILGRCRWVKSALLLPSSAKTRETGNDRVVSGIFLGKRCIFLQRDSSILVPLCDKICDVYSCALPLGLCRLTVNALEAAENGPAQTAREETGEHALLRALDAALAEEGELLTGALSREGNRLTLRCECILPMAREEKSKN